MIGGKYNKWIVILQEFHLGFMLAISKKYSVFTELISELPCEGDVTYEEYFSNEQLFLISSQDPWYEDIIVCLQTLKFSQSFSKVNAKNYVILIRFI